MNKDVFERLPATTNAVESHNRLSKSGKTDILRVAMMATYRIDMANAFEHLARKQGVSTSYATLTKPKSRKRPMSTNEEQDGPPDKHSDFYKGKKS